MDEICRFCLTVSVKMACKISEKLRMMYLSFLNIQIHLSDSLPSYLCSTCFKTLEDIHNFRETVIQNEHKLLQLHNDKNLDVLYQNLLNKNKSLGMLKTEMDEYHHEIDHCSDADYGQCNSINKISVEAKDCVKDIFKIKTDNVTNQDHISNSITPSNKKPKTMKSSSIEKRKRNNITINAIENCLEIKKDMEINTDIITETVQSRLKPMDINIKMKNSLDNIGAMNEITIKNHKCLTCFEYQASQAELIKHYKSYHTMSGSMLNVNQSEISQIDSEGVCNKDNLCNNDENTEKIMKTITSDMDKRPYNCNICGRTFTSVYAIIRHGRAHSSHTLYCSHGCGFSTVYRGALTEHQKRHQNDFKYKCATCGAGFHAKTWHDQHQNIHNNIKPYVCDTCGMAFHMHRYLTSHRTTVHPEIGKGIERYNCPHCDSGAFSNVHSFRAHLEDHNGKRNFLCDLCGKVCRSSEQLKHHNNSHLGLKPFTCSVCHKKFAKKFNLTVHEKAHAGEKHLCNTCGKHFAQRSTLRRHHRRAHTEEKHVCTTCGKHFALRSTLRSHHKTCYHRIPRNPDITIK